MIPLSQIHVPKPCGENWEAMEGNARRRFCAGCGCHVHDLSAMTDKEAQGLLDQAAGRFCVRFQTRPDGTMLTQDAPLPVGPRGLWPRRLAAAASWALAFAMTGFGLTARAETPPHPKRADATRSQAHATAPTTRPLRVTVGKIAMRHPHPSPHATLGEPAFHPAPHPTMGIVAPVPPPKNK